MAITRRTAAVELAVCVLLAGLTVRWGVTAIRLVLYPFEWSSMDGYFVGYAARLFAGLAIYSDHALPPSGYAYVPGYLLPLGLLHGLFGPAVWVERVFAAGLMLATAAVTGHVVRIRTRSVGWGLIAFALCLAPSVFVAWHLVRGLDLLVLFIGLAATAILAEARPLRSTHALLAAVLYVAGFYCKQTALFPWAAGAAILFWRDRSLLFRFLALSLGMGVVIGLGLQHWSDGWFWNNAFKMTSRHPYSWRLLVGLLLLFVTRVPFVVGGAAVAACAQPSAALRHPWVLYWAAVLGSTVLASKLGAGIIYFLPGYVASVLWLCVAAPAWFRALPPGSLRFALAGVAFLQVLMWAYHPLPVPTAETQQNAARLLAGIEARPGRILTERVDSFATLTGRPLEWEATQLPILHKIHGMPVDVLLEDLREQRYAAVLYSGQYFGRVYWLRKTIFTYYQPVTGLQAVPVQLFYGQELYTLLEPKPPEDLPEEPMVPPPDEA